MRTYSRIVRAALSLAVVFGCVVVSLAQTRPTLGGYKEVATDNQEVVSAAEFAVGEQGRQQESDISLVSIEKAEQQVAAGINYKLCLKVTMGDDAEETRDVRVLVFRSLQKQYSLKSWEEESCGESDSEGNHGSAGRTLNHSKSRAQFTNRLIVPLVPAKLNVAVAKQISDDGLHTPAAGSAEHKAILEAVREEYKKGDDQPAQFKVNYLKVHKGWAWINVTPLDASGNQIADEAPMLFQIDNEKWVSRDLNDVGIEGDEHEGPHDPSPKYIKALQKKYPGMPLDIIPKSHK